MKYILIPVKDLTCAKQRLAGLMTREQRSSLAWLMVEHLFHEVSQARGWDRVAVVTLDESVAQLARWLGFELIRETQQTSESASVDHGSHILSERGASSVLRLPIDLPLIAAEDIETILARISKQPGGVIVPSRDGTGTNAIVRTPPELFRSHFGPNSLAKHLQEARRCGVRCELIHLPRVALDLDDPADLEHVLQSDCSTPVIEFLKGLAVDERLARTAQRV